MKLEERVRRYAFVFLVIVAGGVVVSIPIVRESPGTPAIVVFFLILVSAWYGGLGPGLLATALIVLLTIPSSFTSWRILRLVFFLAGGVSISVMAEALHAARRRAEESRQALAAVLTSIGDAVIATDNRGRVTFTNPVAGFLTGWAPEEAVGQPLNEILRISDQATRGPADDSSPRAHRDGIGVGPAGDRRLIARDGTERPIHDRAAPIRVGDGELLGTVLVFQDDTERREYERKLLEANHRKDEFLAMLAHELRNPLGSIKTAVAVLETSKDDHHLAWARGVLNRQIGQLAHLLDDLLDVARLTHGRVALRTERLDADAAIRQAVESVRPLTEGRSHRVDVVTAPGTKSLEADPVRLEQILVNLLGNAVNYTPTGGRIKVTTGQEGDEVVIRVADNGSGIAPEVLPEIFDLFAQGKRSLARTEGGLGVGLTIVKRLVELHGGRVEVHSLGPGQGSTFTVRLPAATPVASPEASPVATPPAASPQAEASAALGSRILIIDDNQDLARGLARLLRHVGHEVRMAYDGPEGIEAAQSYDPDVLLLDIGLPNLDGYEVARRLRQEENAHRSLIIAISGYGQEEDVRRSREAGIDHYLIKPVDIGTISSLIAQSGRGA